MTDPFEDPAAPGGVKWDELNGSLLLISPHAIEQNVNTTFGTKDAVRADVVVLDGPNAGQQNLDVLIFPGVMIGQLRPMVGKRVIGRLGQGVAKPGQKAPWKLLEATAQDKQVGARYLSGQLTSAPTSSSTTEPPF